jgi:hypothetical protein
MDINKIALCDVPNVASVRNMSDFRKARALVRFKNGREFLVTWNARVQRFEVTHWLKIEGRGSEGLTDPFDDIGELFAYLAERAERPTREGVSFLPLEADIEKEMRSTRF